MKYQILPFFVLFLSFIACTKEADYEAVKEPEYTLKKNAYRVTEISGKSNHWGEFTLTLTYDKEEVDKGYRTNAQGDTVGGISVSRGNSYLKYSISDYLPSIDQDSINRLDAELTAKHGKGNYNLWDSLPKVSRSILTATVHLAADDRIEQEKIQTYKPREDTGAGKDFNNEYILVSTVTHIYEYNLDGNIRVNRIMSDQHDPKDAELFKRSLYKTEALYDGDKLTEFVYYTAPGGGNFVETNRYHYSYTGDLLTRITGKDYTREFSYNAPNLTLKTNGVTETYEYDSNGYVTKIQDNAGNIFHIKYEKGNGNFSAFTGLTEQMLNPFFIK